MSRTRTTFAALLLTFAVSAPQLISAQAPPAAGEPAATTEKPRGRLPNLYGKLGVTDDQRERIYAIQAEHGVQIEELLAQLEELRARRDRLVENVLTDGQKRRLHELRAEARREREKRAQEKAADKPAAP